MPPQERNSGFTLVEVSVTVSLLIVGIIALAGVLVSTSHQQEEVEAKIIVLERARSILEEIIGTSSDVIAATYNGRTYIVDGVSGTGLNGEAITVSVDSTNPKLIRVTVTGNWTASNKDYTLRLQTEIYNTNG